jgi:hypothetical protein
MRKLFIAFLLFASFSFATQTEFSMTKQTVNFVTCYYNASVTVDSIDTDYCIINLQDQWGYDQNATIFIVATAGAVSDSVIATVDLYGASINSSAYYTLIDDDVATSGATHGNVLKTAGEYVLNLDDNRQQFAKLYIMGAAHNSADASLNIRVSVKRKNTD